MTGIYGAVPGGYAWRPVLRWGPPGGVDTVDSLLVEARALLDRIEAEVNRLARELFLLKSGEAVVSGPLEPVISSYENVVGELEEFVGGVFARVEKKALAGDIDAARRLRDSTARILAAAVTSSPLGDVGENLSETTRTVLDDFESLLGKVVKTVGIGMALFLAVHLIRLVRGNER